MEAETHSTPRQTATPTSFASPRKSTAQTEAPSTVDLHTVEATTVSSAVQAAIKSRIAAAEASSTAALLAGTRGQLSAARFSSSRMCVQQLLPRYSRLLSHHYLCLKGRLILTRGKWPFLLMQR